MTMHFLKILAIDFRPHVISYKLFQSYHQMLKNRLAITVFMDHSHCNILEDFSVQTN